MYPQNRDLIIKNFVSLVKDCNIQALSKLMVDKGIFTKNEIADIFSTDDERHNSRMFFFKLQRKEQRAYNVLIDCLTAINKKDLADILQHKRSGCTVLKPAYYDEKEDISPKISLPVHVDHTITPLNVQVKYSDKFYDNYRHDAGFEYYYSRSKNRGRLLIINNYDFPLYQKKHPYRNGATVDNSNLQSLFNQMGGWDIQLHTNKTAEEMRMILKSFAEDKINKQYDICFVILMSHGNSTNNETVIYGIDDRAIFESEVERQFNNENCKWFIAKPKILLFQACRGDELDYATMQNTETDSRAQTFKNVEQTITNIRTQEDILIGHSTLLGYKAHRDPYRGSWYVEILCEKFMNHAHNTTVDDLLVLVDQGLRRRMSEMRSMQTAEHSNKGFKKLYLHPGIYSENGTLNRFHQ